MLGESSFTAQSHISSLKSPSHRYGLSEVGKDQHLVFNSSLLVWRVLIGTHLRRPQTRQGPWTDLDPREGHGSRRYADDLGSRLGCLGVRVDTTGTTQHQTRVTDCERPTTQTKQFKPSPKQFWRLMVTQSFHVLYTILLVTFYSHFHVLKPSLVGIDVSMTRKLTRV